MRQIWRRILASALCCSLVLLSSCSAGNPQSAQSGSAEQSSTMGRYVEEVCELPEEMGYIMGIWKMEDGNLELLSNSNAGMMVGPWFFYRSQDNGKTWQKRECAWLEEKGEELGITAMDYAGNGEYYFYYTAIPEEVIEALKSGGEIDEEALMSAIQEKLVKIKADGTAEEYPYEIPVDESGIGLSSFKVAPNGDLLIDTAFTLHQVDPATGETKNSYQPVSGTVEDYIVAGDLLLLQDGEEMKLYDLSTGELHDTISPGEEAAPKENDSKIYDIVAQQTEARLFALGQNDEELYFCDSSGIYRRMLSGTVAERLVEGELTSLNMPALHQQSFLTLDNNEFLILMMNSDNQEQLFRYRYDETVPTVPSTELKVFSLYDNKTVRQAIGLFQRANPDVHVVYETPLSTSSGMTLSDAQRNLSTELLAGKGPDLLVLDGLPLDSYVEKGVLLDLSDLVKPKMEAGEWLPNIAGSFEKEGKIYAVPARFSVPMALVPSGAELNTLSDLADYVQAQGEGTALGQIAPKMLLKQFYPTCSPAWLKEDGSLEAEGFRKFLEDLKRILDMQPPESREEFEFIDSNANNANYGFDFDLEFAGLQMIAGSSKMGVGNLVTLRAVAACDAAIQKLGGGTLQLQPGQVEKAYLPGCVLGINAASGQQEKARQLFEQVFSLEAQKNDFEDGLPVNQAALAERAKNPYEDYDDGMSYATNDEEGNMVLLQVLWPSDSYMQEFLEMLKGLDRPSMTQELVLQIVLEETADYFAGKKSLDDTVNAVTEKLNLYLAE